MDNITILEERAGFAMPVKLPMGQFSSERDRALIDEGGYFFCRGHLTAVPIETQSRRPKYCVDCLSIIEGEL